LKIAWAAANGPPSYAYVDCKLELTCFEGSEMYQMVARGHVQVKGRFEDLGIFLKLRRWQRPSFLGQRAGMQGLGVSIPIPSSCPSTPGAQHLELRPFSMKCQVLLSCLF
jgi:hypothetical protein